MSVLTGLKNCVGLCCECLDRPEKLWVCVVSVLTGLKNCVGLCCECFDWPGKLCECVVSVYLAAHGKTPEMWNRTRPWALVRNQHTRGLISSWKRNISKQQRHELPTVTLTWHVYKYKVHRGISSYVCKYKVHKNSTRCTSTPEVERMFLWWSLCTLYLHVCQVRVIIDDSGLCCCTCVTYFQRWLTLLCGDSWQNPLTLAYSWSLCKPDLPNDARQWLPFSVTVYASFRWTGLSVSVKVRD